MRKTLTILLLALLLGCIALAEVYEGATAAMDTVTVTSEVSGALQTLNAHVGDRVQAGQALPRRMEPVLASAESAEGRPMLMDEDCRGGSMPHVHAEGHSGLADEDCFGGSMAHTHTEGVSRSDHARRMVDIDARQHENDVLPQTIDARALRRAVVMAEVLGKPRALRPRRRAG